MAAYLYPNYKIAAGHDNTVSLVSIESIIPSTDRRFFAPRAYNLYRPGVRKVRFDGKLYYGGTPTADWLFGAVSIKQHEYMITTYCAGVGLSGFVTVQLRPAHSTYKRYNATLTLPDPMDMDQHLGGFKDYRVSFTFMEYISDAP